QMKDVAKNLHVGNIMLLLLLGSMPHYTTIKNIQLFAQEVMPHLRDIWSEYDASHYWPSGFAEDAVAQQAIEPAREPVAVR
ncbi:MAG: hypothetical protein ACYDCQ_11870, partial [Dehalococcoidia bacterium]